jgi:hypothetical protein
MVRREDGMRTTGEKDTYLIIQRNWSWDTYERWLADAMASSLLPP